ncbi:MAG: histidine kinase [Bacteroidota bacterium]
MNQLFRTYDQWTFERIIRHVWYWGAWSTFYIAVNTLAKGGLHPMSSWAAFELLVVPIKIACAYTVAYFLMPRFLYTKRWRAFALWTVGVSIFYGWLLFLVYTNAVYPYVLGKGNYGHTSFIDFFYKAVELIHITSLVICIKFFQNLLRHEQTNNQLQQEKVQAELKYLKNQVQPHFLFNTLNNLYGLILSKDAQAPNVIIKLSEMLGYSLYDSESTHVTLEDEIAYLENYLALEQLRYGEKLNLCYQKSAIPTDTIIAPLILIPFVENAFKHGPAKQDEDARIDLDIQVEGKRLTFKVVNTYEEGELNPSIQSGIGLANVKKRLQLIYPNRYQLKLEKAELYRVELILQLDHHPLVLPVEPEKKQPLIAENQ